MTYETAGVNAGSKLGLPPKLYIYKYHLSIKSLLLWT